MSQDDSPKPKSPPRPPPPDRSKLRRFRLSSLVHPEEVLAETSNLSPKSQDVSPCIHVLSDKLPAKGAAPARPPPPVLKRSSLSLITETQDLNGHPQTSGIRNTETKNDEATTDDPEYSDVLPNERNFPEASPKPARPTRPPPPDPSRLRHFLHTRLTHTQEHVKACDVSPARQNLPIYIDFVSDKSLAKDLSSSEEENSESSSDDASDEATVDGPVYLDVLPNEKSHTTHPKYRTTSINGPPPPRPVVLPRFSTLQPQKSLLCQTRSAEPTEHLYESIDEVLGDDGARGLPGLTRQGRFTSYHSWSERSSVVGDRTARELDILLEWWRNIGGLENLPMKGQEDETVAKPSVSVAQRVKTAMRLYVLLLVQRGTELLNHITELHCTADSLIKSSKKTRLAKLTGGTTGAVGGVAIAAGLALAPLTFGASLVATGVGIGIAAAGGAAGASASYTKKLKWAQVKDKVEKIIANYESQMEDILACLKFIDLGMEKYRKQDGAMVNETGAHLEKMAKVAQEMESENFTDTIGKFFDILHEMEYYFIEEDDSRTKRNSNRQLARKIHEVADQLKECMDQLLRIKNLFRSVDDNVE